MSSIFLLRLLTVVVFPKVVSTLNVYAITSNCVRLMVYIAIVSKCAPPRRGGIQGSKPPEWSLALSPQQYQTSGF